MQLRLLRVASRSLIDVMGSAQKKQRHHFQALACEIMVGNEKFQTETERNVRGYRITCQQFCGLLEEIYLKEKEFMAIQGTSWQKSTSH